MAQQLILDSGTLIIPSAVASWTVQTENSGLSTSGVLILVGEADAGPDYSEEETLSLNSFGPDQVSSVLTKYRSGNLVDAFRAASVPANDPNIVGSPSAFILVKTNPSIKASDELLTYAAASYRFLTDKSYGKLGNMINWQVEAATAEVVPTTGSFTYIPIVGTANTVFRLNGGAANPLTIAANRTPTQFVSDLNGLNSSPDIVATGGVARVTIPAVPGTIAVAVPGGNEVVLTSNLGWNTIPTVGDTMVIPAGSAIKGAVADHNEGAYVIIAADALTITAIKLSDAGHVGATLDGTISAPEVVNPATAVIQASLTVYSPVTISHAALNPQPGKGKTLEIAQLTTGTDLLERSCFNLGLITKVSWISKTLAATFLASSAEYSAQLNVNRAVDNVQEELIAGGEIAMNLGYFGTTATAVITDTTMTITIVGGAGTWGLTPVILTLADYPTLADLVGVINSKAGYNCTLSSAILGQLPTTALDNGTYTFASQFGTSSTGKGALVGKIKIDGYRFFNKVTQESVLVQLQDVAGNAGVVEAATTDLPAPTTALAYLENGDKGSTTAAAFQLALDACEKVRGNFLVPLFSADATADVIDGLTESGSTYVINNVNAACRTHVLKMSTLKKRRNRQAFLSKQTTFTAARSASANIASNRCAMTFQDCKNVASDGSMKQFQPWMSAVVAAGMQAAGFYRPIVAKFANISGALQEAGDFDDQDDSAMENALLSGLLPLKRAETGGYKWVSDQTTYGKDSNFVHNSIQAVYVADMIALTTATRMENAFVGQSVADISASLAKAFLEAVMGDFLRLKLISPSDDAPKGFKNASIRISGTSMIVNCEVKLAGALYFCAINFLISQVQQSA